METRPDNKKANAPQDALGFDPHAADIESDLSNFLPDLKYAWNRFGTPITLAVAIVALSYAGYNFITKNREIARQQAWGDLLGSTSPESLQIVAEDTKNPAVRAKAYLNAGDLLLAESRTAADEDAAQILDSAAQNYQSALDQAPHLIYELNALDGLAVVAESRYDTARAQGYYEKIKAKAQETFPYWVDLADNRLALLPRLAEPVVFAPEPVLEEEPAAEAEAESPPEAAQAEVLEASETE